MSVKTIFRNEKKYHIIGDSIIECGGSADCVHCAEGKNHVIEAWIEKHNPICILCDVKPPCYICAMQKCNEWWNDDGFNREMGTYYGCRKSHNRTYCEDFECKHGFLGWWMDGWEEAFEKRSKAIEKELLDRMRKKGGVDGKSSKGLQPIRKTVHKEKAKMGRIPAPPKKPKRTPVIKKS